MKRLVGLWMVATALTGCAQTGDGIRPTAGLVPASVPSGLPPIQQRINDGPIPPVLTTARADRPIRTSGFAPGVNGGGEIESPRLPSAIPTPTVARSEEAPAPVATATRPAPMPETAPEAMAAAPTPTPPQARPEVTPEGDAEVSRASAAAPTPVGQPVGEWAARVDNDIITWNELQSAVARRTRELDPQMQSDPGVREALAGSVLDHLIDRSLVIQKARRNELKDAKRWELINKGAVQYFEEERLPALIRQNKVEDRYELERMLAERGESLDEIIDSFKLEFVYQQYLMSQATSKISVDLPEMRAYYFENRDHESFHRDAEVTWRELVVRFASHPSREAARAKVDQAVARLGRGEPFEAVVRELGEGPNAEQGGLWTTAPGSYAVAEVNEALGTLAPGQTSAVIEGSGGFHVVRLESNRPAGRMSFEEVQDEIRDILKAEKEAKMIDDYLSDLYRGAVVTTVFSEYVPRHLRGKQGGQ